MDNTDSTPERFGTTITKLTDDFTQLLDVHSFLHDALANMIQYSDYHEDSVSGIFFVKQWARAQGQTALDKLEGLKKTPASQQADNTTPPNQPSPEQPRNSNPLIGDPTDTLVNVHAVIQFLQGCDLLSDNADYRFKPRAADGLHLIGEAALQALRFEIDRHKVIGA